jgi:hypothetical protein
MLKLLLLKSIKKVHIGITRGQVLVAHAYNPVTQEAEIGGSRFEASPGKQFSRPIMKKHPKKGLME